ncbi:hypothetical protein C8J57DRAFT_1462192 [Mycena rebaudengoi]|nr:hypothetical protein C8J57DRAFT_1462192 [Mycena rebaudengoi]
MPKLQANVSEAASVVPSSGKPPLALAQLVLDANGSCPLLHTNQIDSATQESGTHLYPGECSASRRWSNFISIRYARVDKHPKFFSIRLVGGRFEARFQSNQRKVAVSVARRALENLPSSTTRCPVGSRGSESNVLSTAYRDLVNVLPELMIAPSILVAGQERDAGNFAVGRFWLVHAGNLFMSTPKKTHEKCGEPAIDGITITSQRKSHR